MIVVLDRPLDEAERAMAISAASHLARSGVLSRTVEAFALMSNDLGLDAAALGRTLLGRRGALVVRREAGREGAPWALALEADAAVMRLVLERWGAVAREVRAQNLVLAIDNGRVELTPISGAERRTPTLVVGPREAGDWRGRVERAFMETAATAEAGSSALARARALGWPIIVMLGDAGRGGDAADPDGAAVVWAFRPRPADGVWDVRAFTDGAALSAGATALAPVLVPVSAAGAASGGASAVVPGSVLVEVRGRFDPIRRLLGLVEGAGRTLGAESHEVMGMLASAEQGLLIVRAAGGPRAWEPELTVGIPVRGLDVRALDAPGLAGGVDGPALAVARGRDGAFEALPAGDGAAQPVRWGAAEEAGPGGPPSDDVAAPDAWIVQDTAGRWAVGLGRGPATGVASGPASWCVVTRGVGERGVDAQFTRQTVEALAGAAAGEPGLVGYGSARLSAVADMLGPAWAGDEPMRRLASRIAWLGWRATVNDDGMIEATAEVRFVPDARSRPVGR